MTDTRDHAGVGFPPPFVYLGFVLLGPPIDRLLHWPALAGSWMLGAALVVSGFAVLAIAQGAFRRVGQNPAPWTPSGAIVETGLYAITRNPMYVAMTTIALGLAVLLHSWAALLLVPVAVAVIRYQVIAREEAYLRATFGAAFADYCRRVPRWL